MRLSLSMLRLFSCDLLTGVSPHRVVKMNFPPHSDHPPEYSATLPGYSPSDDEGKSTDAPSPTKRKAAEKTEEERSAKEPKVAKKTKEERSAKEPKTAEKTENKPGNAEICLYSEYNV